MNWSDFYARDRMDKQLGTAESYSYGLPRFLFAEGGAQVHIGKFCSIATSTIFLGGEHRPDWVTTYPFPALAEAWVEATGIEGHGRAKGDVTIGNDVWIGEGVAVLSGVTIGDGAVVGAYTVIAKDVPAYGIVVGNPARLIRKRFSEEVIAALLKIRWWDWEEVDIREAIPLLCSDGVDEFIRRYGK